MLSTQYDALYKIGNMLAHKPQAVIFDMDGLIIDTEVVARTAWQKAAAELGYLMDDDLYSRFVGRRTRDCNAMLIEAYGDAFPCLIFSCGASGSVRSGWTDTASRLSLVSTNCSNCSTPKAWLWLSPPVPIVRMLSLA